MRSPVPRSSLPSIVVRVSGKLFSDHLAYLEQLIESAEECQLWPVLDLSQLAELDQETVVFLINGENRDFGLIDCPTVVRERMELVRDRLAA
jgi:hypothetical protein